MEKIQLKIRGIFCQHCVETKAGTRADFKVMKKNKPLAFSLIGSILILLFSIIGCSDVPYTGPILTVDDVARYVGSTDEQEACIQDGFDSVCIKLVSEEVDVQEEDDDTPIVHVHPTNMAYVFYYKNEPILRAERDMDTTQIVQELIDTGQAQVPPNAGNPGGGGALGNGNNAPGNWIIQIYYPRSFRETNRRLRRLDIRVIEGMRIRRDNQRDLKIEGFTRSDISDSTPGVQFSVETEASQIMIQVNRLVPDHTATFRISTDDVASGKNTSTLQVRPVR